MPPKLINRRDFIKYTSATLAVTAFCPSRTFASVAKKSRVLSFKNLHTGETLQAAYFANNRFINSELHKINHICRDFRRNEVYEMDKKLLIQLEEIKGLLRTEARVEIISGYRSPITNDMLRSSSSKVAKKSFHMQGRAIDFRLQGIPLSEVRDAAKQIKAGGVGYYPESDFVHIDTGTVRFW